MPPALHQLLDALAIAIVGIFAIVGAARGMLRGVLRIVAFLASVLVGRFAAPWIAPSLVDVFHWDSSTAEIFVWVVVCCLVAAALGVCLLRFDPWIEKARVAVLDPVFGLLLGVTFGGVVVASLILTTLSLASPESVLAQEIHASTGGKLTKSIAKDVKPILVKAGI